MCSSSLVLLRSSFNSRLTNNPPSVMKHFYEIGVDGMECFPPPHKQDENSHIYYEFAKEHNLLVTSGSDYHGKIFVRRIMSRKQGS